MRNALIQLINDYYATGDMETYYKAVEMVESNYDELVTVAEDNGLYY